MRIACQKQAQVPASKWWLTVDFTLTGESRIAVRTGILMSNDEYNWVAGVAGFCARG